MRLTFLSFLAFGALSFADESENENDSSDVLVSDVFGGKEAPLDMNIMPWQKTDAKLSKPDVTSSILDRIMRPIDRSSLKRELDFIESSRE